MKTITLKLPKPHSQQQRIKAEASRFNVVDCGRRFGKTTLGIDMTTPALHGYPIGWFSPTYKMMLEVWRDTSNIFQPVTKRANSQERRIELITDGIVEMWSLDNPDAARGRKYKRVIIDEAAMVPKLQEAWQASIRPTLTDYQGDAYFFSTPKGHNFFKTLYDYGNDPLRQDWRCWQLPTAANPFIKSEEIEAARQELPERIFRQEYLAEFIEDAGVFRGVMDCATATEQTEPINGHEYIFGVDWGKLQDFTVITVIDANTSEIVCIERFNQIDYIIQMGKLKRLYEQFRPYSIIAERNAIGEPIIETLQREGLPVQPFVTTNQSKALAIEALQLAFERKDIKIIPDSVLIAELQAFEGTRLPSGMMRYAAPEGYHDDCVISLALAWQGALVPAPAGVTISDFTVTPDYYKTKRKSRLFT